MTNKDDKQRFEESQETRENQGIEEEIRSITADIKTGKEKEGLDKSDNDEMNIEAEEENDTLPTDSLIEKEEDDEVEEGDERAEDIETEDEFTLEEEIEESEEDEEDEEDDEEEDNEEDEEDEEDEEEEDPLAYQDRETGEDNEQEHFITEGPPGWDPMILLRRKRRKIVEEMDNISTHNLMKFVKKHQLSRKAVTDLLNLLNSQGFKENILPTSPYMLSEISKKVRIMDEIPTKSVILHSGHEVYYHSPVDILKKILRRHDQKEYPMIFSKDDPLVKDVDHFVHYEIWNFFKCQAKKIKGFENGNSNLLFISCKKMNLQSIICYEDVNTNLLKKKKTKKTAHILALLVFADAFKQFKSRNRKLKGIYFSLANFLPADLQKIKLKWLIAIIPDEADIQDFFFKAIVRPLSELEKGIEFEWNNQVRKFIGSLYAIIADHPGAAELAGIRGVKANYPSRTSLCHRERLGNVKESAEMRNDGHLKDLKENLDLIRRSRHGEVGEAAQKLQNLGLKKIWPSLASLDWFKFNYYLRFPPCIDHLINLGLTKRMLRFTFLHLPNGSTVSQILQKRLLDATSNHPHYHKLRNGIIKKAQQGMWTCILTAHEIATAIQILPICFKGLIDDDERAVYQHLLEMDSYIRSANFREKESFTKLEELITRFKVKVDTVFQKRGHSFCIPNFEMLDWFDIFISLLGPLYLLSTMGFESVNRKMRDTGLKTNQKNVCRDVLQSHSESVSMSFLPDLPIPVHRHYTISKDLDPYGKKKKIHRLPCSIISAYEAHVAAGLRPTNLFEANGSRVKISKNAIFEEWKGFRIQGRTLKAEKGVLLQV